MEAAMLAAESAWRILHLEHYRLRELSATIERTIQVDHWFQRAGQVTLLRALISGLQTFNDAAHRPKGAVLIEALRQRPDMNGFLDELETDQARCDSLLEDALAALDALEHDGAGSAERCIRALQAHRRLLLNHLEREDTVLQLRTNEMLTPEEWSAVASSISEVIEGRGPGSRSPERR
jgi:hemerythrin-like domain-containing protein